jgi:hypothetical protein
MTYSGIMARIPRATAARASRMAAVASKLNEEGIAVITDLSWMISEAA